MFKLIIAAGLVICSVAIAEAAVTQGEEIAQSHCAVCHAIGRSGASPRAEAPPFRTLHERYPVDMLQEALAEGIFVGHPDMPRFVFQPDEIAALIGYLKSLEPPARRR